MAWPPPIAVSVIINKGGCGKADTHDPHAAVASNPASRLWTGSNKATAGTMSPLSSDSVLSGKVQALTERHVMTLHSRNVLSRASYGDSID